MTLGETGAPVDVVIVSVAEGSEAERAGLSAGDVLVSVDGVAVVHSIAEARGRLAGPLADDALVAVRRGRSGPDAAGHARGGPSMIATARRSSTSMIRGRPRP